MKENKKQLLLVLACLGVALLIAILFPTLNFGAKGISSPEQMNKEFTILKQDVLGVSPTPVEVTKLYDQGKLIGILTDKHKLSGLLKEIYHERYETEFPNTNIGLGTDIYYTDETSFFLYENIDDKIVDYLKENERFSLEVNRIEFTNGAVVYVKNMDDFETAKRQYLLNFIDATALDLISVNQLPPELDTYGIRDIGIQVVEQAAITKGYASLSDIKMNVQEIVYFLSYGYDTTINYYTTVQYDTVEGVASKTGLSTQQLITLNSDKLKSATQLLSVGTELNVTFFHSPINVIVTRERIAKEVVYAPETKYIPNADLREGISRVKVAEEDGSKNVFYNETYINGEMSEHEVVYEEITLSPVQEVVEYGTKIIPGIGTGKFRYPVDNVHITCHWYCYAGHRGLDVQNSYNKYGSVKAADRGEIDQVGYNSINGYFVWINHNNGYRTYYGHMSQPCYYRVGIKVNKGEVIGQIGRTGKATGPHVHFVIEYYGKRSDPCNWLGC